MKSTKGLFVFLVFTIFSCKKNEKVPLNFPDDISFLEEIKNYPSITATTINQLQISKIDIKWNSSNFNVQINYFSDGRIKQISGSDMDKTLEYTDNQLNTGNEVFELDKNGLAINNLSKKAKYYYKDGYLLRTGNNAFKINYNVAGNLVNYLDDMHSATYEYTNFPNNIRQEVFRSQLLIWNFRDLYLGKYSTNLIKKASFDGFFGSHILNFSYEFDEQNRVKKMKIERVGRDVIEYNLFY